MELSDKNRDKKGQHQYGQRCAQSTYLASGATIASFFGISVMRTSVVSTRAAMEAAFSMALIVTYDSSTGNGELEITVSQDAGRSLINDFNAE